MAKAPNPVGRPTIYEPAVCELLVASLKKGNSLAEACLDLDIRKSTLHKWLKVHPELIDAVGDGLEYSLAQTVRIGKDNWDNDKFNTRLYELYMRNVHDWRSKDKDNTTVVSTGSVDDAVKIAVDIAKQKRYADK